MEDAVQISQPEGDFEQKISETNQDLNFSPSAVQAMIMTEAKQMYLRYCSKHLGEADHAQKVYVFWKNKHYDYNYNDALERSSAKRSLITLFYQLEVSPYLLQGGSGPFHFDQEGTKALDSISDRIRSSDCCDDHDDNEMNLLSQRFSPPYYPTSPVDSHCCSFWDTNQDDILLSENVYQNDQDLDISRRAGEYMCFRSLLAVSYLANSSGSRPEKPNDVYHSKLISKHEIFTSDGEVSPHALTRNANKSTRKGPTSPPFIEHSAAKRVKSNKYEYRVISQNGMPIIEIID